MAYSKGYCDKGLVLMVYNSEYILDDRTLFHEFLHSLGTDDTQHVDAIQAENLIRRVMGIASVNDGSKHADGSYIPNPTSKPKYR